MSAMSTILGGSDKKTYGEVLYHCTPAYTGKQTPRPPRSGITPHHRKTNLWVCIGEKYDNMSFNNISLYKFIYVFSVSENQKNLS